jgi:uncharacterized protein (DUF697 family)
LITSQQIVTGPHAYRIKAWYRAFLLIFGAPAIAGGIVMSVLASKSANGSIPLLITLLFFAVGIYLVALAQRSRVTIDGNRIEIRGAFTDRTADLNEITGYRTVSTRNGHYIQIYLNSGSRSLNMSSYFDRDEAFDSWFRQIPNLDHRDRDAILDKVAQDPQLGATPQDRLGALSAAKTNSIFALVIAVAAAIAANWGIPVLYVPFSVALALVPIVLAVMRHNAPLLYTVFKRKDDPRAELLYALIVASFGLFIRARSIHFITFQSLGLVIAFLALLYIAAFYHSLFESISPARTFFALLLFGGLYGYGAVAVADAVGDQTTPQHFVVHVTGKHFTSGRSRSYYLELEPWGPLELPNTLSVSQSIYDKATPGDDVCLDLRPGRLNASWYTQVSSTAAPLDSQR